MFTKMDRTSLITIGTKMRQLISIIRFIKNHPLGKKFPFLSFFSFLAYQFRIKIIRKKYIHNWLEGSKFYCIPNEHGISGNIYLGLHEFNDMGFLLHFLEPNDLFLDIGANVGSYTILAGIVKKSHVLSFEPIPSTYSRLKSNILLNGKSNIKLHNIGLSNKSSTLNFSFQNNTTNRVVNNDDKKSIKVAVKKLDDFDISPTMIKIDVEGFEYFVLEGGKETLKSSKLKCIIIELNSSGKLYGIDDLEIYNFLISLNFIAYNYDPFSRNLKKLNFSELGKHNTLFLRDGYENEIYNRLKSSRYFEINKVKF